MSKEAFMLEDIKQAGAVMESSKASVPQISYEDRLKTVKLNLTFNILLFSLDEFSDTPYYKQETKQILNRAKEIVERRANQQAVAMYKAEPLEYQRQLFQYENVAEMIASADLYDLGNIHQGLIKYFEDKKAEQGKEQLPPVDTK